MSGGCAGFKCAAETDFAALVNVIDFCEGLYFEEEDDAPWQPLGATDSNSWVATVLQPARQARNGFAHNSRLAFDDEAEVVAGISALKRLLEVLPVASSPVAEQRATSLAALNAMLELDCSSATGAGMAGRASAIPTELQSLVAPVLAYMRGVCEADTAALSTVVDEGVVAQICAPVPRQPTAAATTTSTAMATLPAMGGAGQGAGAVGNQVAALVVPAQPSTLGAWDWDRLLDDAGGDNDGVIVARHQCLYTVQRALARVASLEAWLEG